MRTLIVGIALAGLSATAQAQTRAYLVRLGSDTIAVERFVRTGNHIEGTMVRRLPQTVLLKYTVHLNDDGSVAWYEQQTTRADGSLMPNAPSRPLKITFTGDSVIREIVRNNQPVVLRAAAPKVTLPSIPISWLGQELVLRAAKRGAQVHTIGVSPQQEAPSAMTVRFIGSDSAEIVNQGFRTGFKLNAAGEILRGDGTLTTQKFVATPYAAADINTVAAAWAARDAAGQGMGVASPRDTVTAVIEGARITIDYGRPAKRGRAIWGSLVPFDTTWRMGANAATQFKTERDIEMGGVTIPAGMYTLWLLPGRAQSFLLVNSQTGQWGTEHDASRDIARIPLEAHMSLPNVEERFRIFVQGDMLMLHWDRGGYGVRIKAK